MTAGLNSFGNHVLNLIQKKMSTDDRKSSTDLLEKHLIKKSFTSKLKKIKTLGKNS